MINNENKQTKNAGRWWESYLIRYSIGTIVGAVLVYALLDQFAPDLKTKALMMPNITEDHIFYLAAACDELKDNSACILQLSLMQDLYGFNFSQLLLLGVYGLAFCYIASSPVLVAHAIRRQYSSLPRIKGKTSSEMLLLATFSFVLGFELLFLFTKADWSARITLMAVCFFVFSQAVLLFREFRAGYAPWSFYVRLENARQRSSIDLDSYRHLRENGNAFLIVVFEIILFAAASAICHLTTGPTKDFTTSYWLVLVLLVAWILPGAMVYFLGHRIEALMIEAENTPPGMPYSPDMESEAKPDRRR